MTVFIRQEIIYQASAPAALLEDAVAVVDSTPFSESPGPVTRTAYYEGRSEATVEDVPDIGSGWYDDPPPVVRQPGYYESPSTIQEEDVPEIGSGWFDDAPPLVFPRPRYFESTTAFLDDVVVVVAGDLVFTESPGPTLRVLAPPSRTDMDWADVPLIGSGWFTNPPDVVKRPEYFESRSEPELFQPEIGEDVFTTTALPVLRTGYFESPSAITEEDVPEIGSGWYQNPPPVVFRPFVAFPGEPPGDEFEPVAVEDAFSEGPYLLLRRPFHESSSEPQLADVQPIGSGWFTNPPPVILRPGHFLSVAQPTVEPVPEIGSGWFTNPPTIVFRPGYYPSTTVLPFDIPGAPLRELCPPLVATLVHQGNLTVVEITNGILKADEVESTIAGFAFLVHQGNLVAEEITDGTLKADEC